MAIIIITLLKDALKYEKYYKDERQNNF